MYWMGIDFSSNKCRLEAYRYKYRKEFMDTFQPNRIPFKCVVCSGFGTLKSGTRQCHACSGKGYVIVDQDLEIIGRDINTEIQIGGQDAQISTD